MQDSGVRRGEPDVPTLWTDKQVAAFLNVSLASVRRWRLTDFGPPFYRVGASIRYDPKACSSWLESRRGGGAT
jgi:hypothetical protein